MQLTGCTLDYRSILPEQIAATLDDPAEFDDEIRSLFDAIRTESASW